MNLIPDIQNSRALRCGPSRICRIAGRKIRGISGRDSEDERIQRIKIKLTGVGLVSFFRDSDSLDHLVKGLRELPHTLSKLIDFNM